DSCWTLADRVFVNHAAFHYERDVADGTDVCERIAGYTDNVGIEPGRDRADLIFHAQRFGGGIIRGDERLHGRHAAAFDAINKFISLMAEGAGHRIRAENNDEPGRLHRFFEHGIVIRPDFAHSGKALRRVAADAEIIFFVVEIILKNQTRLRIEKDVVLGHQ